MFMVMKVQHCKAVSSSHIFKAVIKILNVLIDVWGEKVYLKCKFMKVANFFFLGPCLPHMEVPRLGVESYTTKSN